MYFHYITYMATPQHKNPWSGGHEIYNFGGPFLGHHYYTLSLSDLCLGVKNKNFKEIMYFHHMYITLMAAPQHQNPDLRRHEFAILADPSSVIITMHLVCLNMPKSLRKTLKEIMQFQYMTCMTTPQLHVKTPAPGVMKFTILVDRSLVNLPVYMYFFCLFYAWEQRKRFLKAGLDLDFLPPGKLGAV